MRATIYPVEVQNGWRLAILARPRGGDWLGDEVRSWKGQGIGAVVSLLDELQKLDLVFEADECAKGGLEYVAIPVPDRGVPASAEEFGAAVERVGTMLAAGRSVGVHCRQGVGRSALFAASLLAAAGVPVAEAFARVQTSRGVPVPDTSAQREFVERFAATALSEAG